MSDAQTFTNQILNTYNPNSVIPFTDPDGFYHFTYLTINTINNKFYLGKHTTKNLNDGYIGSGNMFRNAIKKHGYLNFQHYRLQFFNTAKDAYLAEGLLITADVIKKYKDELKVCYNLRTGGFGGGGLSEESKEKMSKAIKDALARPEYKEKRSKSLKETLARPEIKEKLSKASKESWSRPEVKEKMSKSLKETFARPEIKEKLSKASKETWSRPEYKEKQSKIQKESHSRPEYKEKRSKASKEMWTIPEYKEKRSKSLKETLARPEYREKQRKASKEMWLRPEYKEKHSKSLKENWTRPEYREKQSKASKETWSRPEVKEKHSKSLKETFANKEMIFILTGEKKTVHTNDVLSHLKAGWTFTQSYIGIYNEKLHIQKTIPFRKIKNKDALYKKLIGYLENGYEIGCLSILKEETIQPAVLLGEYCTKRKMYALF